MACFMEIMSKISSNISYFIVMKILFVSFPHTENKKVKKKNQYTNE